MNLKNSSTLKIFTGTSHAESLEYCNPKFSQFGMVHDRGRDRWSGQIRRSKCHVAPHFIVIEPLQHCQYNFRQSHPESPTKLRGLCCVHYVMRQLQEPDRDTGAVHLTMLVYNPASNLRIHIRSENTKSKQAMQPVMQLPQYAATLQVVSETETRIVQRGQHVCLRCWYLCSTYVCQFEVRRHSR